MKYSGLSRKWPLKVRNRPRVKWSPERRWKQWKIMKPSPQKVVSAAYQRRSFTIGFQLWGFDSKEFRVLERWSGVGCGQLYQKWSNMQFQLYQLEIYKFWPLRLFINWSYRKTYDVISPCWEILFMNKTKLIRLHVSNRHGADTPYGNCDI